MRQSFPDSNRNRWTDHFNDGAGDDIIVGGLGGDHFNVDSGNDKIYGDAIDRSLDDGDHDTVRFDGEFEQFKLSVKADERTTLYRS